MEKWVRDAAGMEIEVPNFEGVRVRYRVPLDAAEAGRTDAEITAAENRMTTGKVPEAKGWFLLREMTEDSTNSLYRPSAQPGTGPETYDGAMLLNIESDTVGGVDAILKRIYDFLSRYEGMTELR